MGSSPPPERRRGTANPQTFWDEKSNLCSKSIEIRLKFEALVVVQAVYEIDELIRVDLLLFLLFLLRHGPLRLQDGANRAEVSVALDHSDRLPLLSEDLNDIDLKA